MRIKEERNICEVKKLRNQKTNKHDWAQNKRRRVIFVRELIEVLALQTHVYVPKRKEKICKKEGKRKRKTHTM